VTPQDNPQAMGLKVGDLPGGLYACKKMKDWKPESLAKDIPHTFKEITEGRTVDSARPFVEFYRSQQELVLQAPIANQNHLLL
jgi:DNA gyrase inhibitor GyrI